MEFEREEVWKMEQAHSAMGLGGLYQAVENCLLNMVPGTTHEQVHSAP
jgi:hypothetical protein